MDFELQLKRLRSSDPVERKQTCKRIEDHLIKASASAAANSSSGADASKLKMEAIHTLVTAIASPSLASSGDSTLLSAAADSSALLTANAATFKPFSGLIDASAVAASLQKLVKLGVLSWSATLQALVASIASPTVTTAPGVLSSITSLLFAHIASTTTTTTTTSSSSSSTGSYVSPFGLQAPIHPFAAVLIAQPHLWPHVLHETERFLRLAASPDYASAALAALQPFYAFVFASNVDSLAQAPVEEKLALLALDHSPNASKLAFLLSHLSLLTLTSPLKSAKAQLVIRHILRHSKQTPVDDLALSERLLNHTLTVAFSGLQLGLPTHLLLADLHEYLDLVCASGRVLASTHTLYSLIGAASFLALNADADSDAIDVHIGILQLLCSVASRRFPSSPAPSVASRAFFSRCISLSAITSVHLLSFATPAIANKASLLLADNLALLKALQATLDTAPSAADFADPCASSLAADRAVQGPYRELVLCFAHLEARLSTRGALAHPVPAASHPSMLLLQSYGYLSAVVSPLHARSGSMQTVALQSLVRILSERSPLTDTLLVAHSSVLLSVTLFLLAQQTDALVVLPETTHCLLFELLPLLAERCKTSSVAVLRFVNSLGGETSHDRTLSIRLHAACCKSNYRLLPKLVSQVGSTQTLAQPAYLSSHLAIAASLHDICEWRGAQYGKDVLPALHCLITDHMRFGVSGANETSTSILSLCFESLNLLCQDGVIDFQSTWKAMRPKLLSGPEDTATLTALPQPLFFAVADWLGTVPDVVDLKLLTSVVDLGSAGGAKDASAASTAASAALAAQQLALRHFVTSLLELLWSAGAEHPVLECRARAFESLCKFDFGLLVDLLKLEHRKEDAPTPQPSGAEISTPEVPQSGAVKLLDGPGLVARLTRGAAFPVAESALPLLQMAVVHEVALLPRSLFQTKARGNTQFAKIIDSAQEYLHASFDAHRARPLTRGGFAGGLLQAMDVQGRLFHAAVRPGDPKSGVFDNASVAAQLVAKSSKPLSDLTKEAALPVWDLHIRLLSVRAWALFARKLFSSWLAAVSNIGTQSATTANVSTAAVLAIVMKEVLQLLCECSKQSAVQEANSLLAAAWLASIYAQYTHDYSFLGTVLVIGVPASSFSVSSESLLELEESFAASSTHALAKQWGRQQGGQLLALAACQAIGIAYFAFAQGAGSAAHAPHFLGDAVQRIADFGNRIIPESQRTNSEALVWKQACSASMVHLLYEMSAIDGDSSATAEVCNTLSPASVLQVALESLTAAETAQVPSSHIESILIHMVQTLPFALRHLATKPANAGLLQTCDSILGLLTKRLGLDFDGGDASALQSASLWSGDAAGLGCLILAQCSAVLQSAELASTVTAFPALGASTDFPQLLSIVERQMSVSSNTWTCIAAGAMANFAVQPSNPHLSSNPSCKLVGEKVRAKLESLLASSHGPHCDAGIAGMASLLGLHPLTALHPSVDLSASLASSHVRASLEAFLSTLTSLSAQHADMGVSQSAAWCLGQCLFMLASSQTPLGDALTSLDAAASSRTSLNIRSSLSDLPESYAYLPETSLVRALHDHIRVCFASSTQAHLGLVLLCAFAPDENLRLPPLEWKPLLAQARAQLGRADSSDTAAQARIAPHLAQFVVEHSSYSPQFAQFAAQLIKTLPERLHALMLPTLVQGMSNVCKTLPPSVALEAFALLGKHIADRLESDSAGAALLQSWASTASSLIATHAPLAPLQAAVASVCRRVLSVPRPRESVWMLCETFGRFYCELVRAKTLTLEGLLKMASDESSDLANEAHFLLVSLFSLALVLEESVVSAAEWQRAYASFANRFCSVSEALDPLGVGTQTALRLQSFDLVCALLGTRAFASAQVQARCLIDTLGKAGADVSALTGLAEPGASVLLHSILRRVLLCTALSVSWTMPWVLPSDAPDLSAEDLVGRARGWLELLPSSLSVLLRSSQQWQSNSHAVVELLIRIVFRLSALKHAGADAPILLSLSSCFERCLHELRDFETVYKIDNWSGVFRLLSEQQQQQQQQR